METGPKSFWGSTEDLDPEKQWITAYDDSPLMALEAELIYATTSRGLSWESALELELWQLAAALGLHRIETRAQRDNREITEAKSEYWDQTGEARSAHLEGYHARREESRRRRRAEAKGRGSDD